MPKFSCGFDNFATTTANKTALLLHANAAGEEGEIVELCMTGAGSAAAADRQHEAKVLPKDATTAGTAGSNPTPEKFHQKSAAAALLAGIEYSAEPTTYGSVFLLLFGFNQRGGLRWGVPRGEGIVIRNADTNVAIGFLVKSDAAGAVDGFGHWWEP